jgi:hypothetical protein
MSLCDLTLGDSAPTLDALRWCSAFKRISFDIRSTRRTGIARYGYGSIYVVKMNRDRSDRIQKRLGGRIEVKIIRFRVPRLARWRPVRRHADPRFRRLPTWRDLHRRRGRVGHAGLQHQLRLLSGNSGPALTGPNFVSYLTFTKITAPQLQSFISSQMPANAPGSLTAAQYNDIFAYILSYNHYPAGSEPLSAASLGCLNMLPYPAGK